MIRKLFQNIESVIVGKTKAVEIAATVVLARGHLLIEDVPGTGKTTLAKSLAKSLHADMKRVQCTPDLLPSDITGVPIFNQKTGEFEFRCGPVFTNILLADEINRATPRSQSALLECMEESCVSMDGQTYKLPDLFMVMATQNPVDNAGTYPLPEAQLDRFMVRLELGYPHINEEVRILTSQSNVHPLDSLRPVLSIDDLLDLRRQTQNVQLSEDIARFAAEITHATRSHGELRLGASPRATIALVRAARAYAFIQGDAVVTPDHVRAMAVPVLAHRLIVKSASLAQGKTQQSIVVEVVKSVPPPV